MSSPNKKILIIRFSSFGDIIQALSVPPIIKQQWPEAEIHWITRSDSEKIVSSSPAIDKVISFDRSYGLKGLIKLSFQMRDHQYTHIYDAHNNIRSFIMCLVLTSFFLKVLNPFSVLKFARRSKYRIKRFLLFKIKLNLFPKPFITTDSFMRPLYKWGLSGKPVPQDLVADPIELPFKKYIAIAPGAAWPMKTWPLSHWKELVSKMNKYSFVVLGGPGDTLGSEIEKIDPLRIKDMSGKASWGQTAYLLKNSQLSISADTGTLHYGDIQGVPTIALLGPTAFGQPGGENTKILEVPLSCRPCTKDGRGKCQQSVYQKCMVDIQPEKVAKQSEEIINAL